MVNNRHTNQFYIRLALIAITAVFIVVNVITEILPASAFNVSLVGRSILAVGMLYMIRLSTFKVKSYLRMIAVGLIFLLVVHFILNSINVYGLDQSLFVQQFCSLQRVACRTITQFFFDFKIYRFITLSSYFFTFPLMIILLSSFDYATTYKIPNKHMHYLFGFIFLVAITMHLAQDAQKIYLSLIQSYQVRNETFNGRFTFKNGGASYYGWIRVFSDFVINQTSDSAVLLIPPQSDIYKAEGNRNYFRWFLYPRTLLHLEEVDLETMRPAKHIVISAGECDTKDCVWPNFAIDGEKIETITLIDRKTQEVTATHSAYQPQNFQDKWGLITLH